MTKAIAATGSLEKPSLWTKLAYGFGSVAYGIKDGGFNFFLLIFYAQVVGLDARLVGLAILIALVFDAFSDPIVGYWSDNFRSKWGRRHPFMYAAAIPVAVSYYFLWLPPEGWNNTQLFWYVVLLAILIRTFITFYETPSTALVPEMSPDYDERSSILAYRWFFGWFGGNGITIVMFILVFPVFVTATISNGQFNKDAYAVYALMASLFMFIAILVSSLGTHHLIAKSPAPPPKRTITPRVIFREIFETLSNRSFGALFIAGMFGYIASGFASGLNFYITAFFWGFSPEQLGIIAICVIISCFIGLFMAPWVSRKVGKKKGAIIVGIFAFSAAPMPVVLKLLGVLTNDPDANFPIVLIVNTIDVGLIICYQILASSMIADLVEEAELRTGRRNEGIFFAAVTFIRKCGLGLGIVLASGVVSGIGLATGAAQGEVPDDTLWRLGATYVPIIWGLWAAMVIAITFYKIDRKSHEENLRKLEERKTAA